MDDHFDESVDLNRIVRESHYSKYHFIRLFRDCYGCTPHQYLTRKRIRAAKVALCHTDGSIGEICRACGFSSPASFTHLFRKHTALSPSGYRAAFRKRAARTQSDPFSLIPGCYGLSGRA